MADEEKPGLVALRDRRAEVIAVLEDGYANELLDERALEDRLARAHGATDVATLDGLTTDLVKRDRVTLTVAPRTMRALFSSVERRGAWQVPQAITMSATFGSVVIDLREATFQAGVTEIKVRAVFGNIEIYVPPDLAVECDGRAILASFESDTTTGVIDPSRPLLRVTGSAVFGNVEVKLRSDDERRLQAPASTHALPPHEE